MSTGGLCSAECSSFARTFSHSFARHETFHPRYGWLKKGVELINKKPNAFASEDVHMQLGVGKNMANAIRYWCEAFGLIENASRASARHPLRNGQMARSKAGGRSLSGVEGRRNKSVFAPELSVLALRHSDTDKERGPESVSALRLRSGVEGRRPEVLEGLFLTTTAEHLIAGAKALDPYLENTATLWWLHYQLLKTQKATTWNFVLDHFGRTHFTADQLLADLKKYVRDTFPNYKIADSSLVKDVSLFLRMYSFDETQTFHEDSIDSPFIELGLLHKRDKEYSFVVGAKPTLPNAIITAACLDFAAHHSHNPAEARSLRGLEAPRPDALEGRSLSGVEARSLSSVEARAGAKSITFASLMRENLSPVKAFRLTESSLYDALENSLNSSPSPTGKGIRRKSEFAKGRGAESVFALRPTEALEAPSLERRSLSPVEGRSLSGVERRLLSSVEALFLSDTAGVKQLAFTADPEKLADKFIRGYYRNAV